MTPAEKSLEAVRALAEGRAPRRVLQCVPVGWKEPVVKPASPSALLATMLPPPRVKVPGMNLDGTPRKTPEPRTFTRMVMEFLRETPGEFTTKDAVAALRDKGFESKNLNSNVVSRLRTLPGVEVVRREGVTIIFQFTGSKPQTQGDK